ncbi:MAG: DUF3365 domain-containing protein [Aquificaceae bacterium]|nr:DUF3365 domain-containing protein [Aquificaceae bacterium]
MKGILPKSIRWKIGLPILLFGVVAGLGTGFYTYKTEVDNAVYITEERVKVAITFSDSSREYVRGTLRPLIFDLLDRAKGCVQEDFILEAQSSSFFTASIFNMVNEKTPDFRLRQVAYNPINPKNRPTPEEAHIINFMRANNQKEYVGVVEMNGQRHFVHAFGKVADAGCMRCHSTREAMPKSLIAKYNPQYDPNWKVGELVGAVMVSVPFEAIILKAQLDGLLSGLAVFSVFLLMSLFVVVALNILVFKPVEELQRKAEEIAKGNVDEPIEVKSQDEIGKLAESFERMRVSIKKVMDLLK